MPGKAAAPKSPAEMLLLFRFYREQTGLDGLLGTLDLQGVSPRQIYHIVHNRPPESLEAALADRHFSARDILVGKLTSDEFKANLVPQILATFPQKSRLLFIRLPHAPGADLADQLALRSATLDSEAIANAPPANIFRIIKDVVLEAPVSSTLFVHGPIRLETLEAWRAPRFTDRLFTVLAHPIERLLSELNHLVERLTTFDHPASPEITQWRTRFGITQQAKPHPPEKRIDLAHRILREGGILQPNVMSHILGNGTAKIALENLVTRNIEVTDARHYPAWCHETWGIDILGPAPPSPGSLTRDHLTQPDHDLLEPLISEDLKLYQVVADQLDRANRHALTGPDLLGSAQNFHLEPPADTPTDTDLLLTFESLGENCEFGLVQRRCGAEPIGLLRFASAPLPKLMKALREGFVGLGEPANITVELSSNGREYMVADKCFGFYSHAWVLAAEKTPAEVHQRESRRLPFLRRKLIEDLTTGEKIFVYHGMTPLTLDEARALNAALRAYGPTTLLWVERALSPDQAGSVSWIETGLLKGFVDRFAPGENAHDLSLESWLSLCRNARETMKNSGLSS